MGVTFVAQALISFALSYAASRLLAPKNKSLARDDKPTTTSERGSRLPLLIGRERVGPILAWAGDRHIKKERIPGGKGLETPKQNIYYERGWHLLVVGPAYRLHRIRQHGKVIFNGPIDSVSHPSGSTLSCGKEGTFRIFWGETDQPVNGPPDFTVNDSLAKSSRVAIASRWPFYCYVEWLDKRLGTSPAWQLLDYELEVRPIGSPLTGSSPWIEPTRTLSTQPYSVTAVANGVAGTASIEVAGDRTAEFRNGVLLRLSGNSGVADRDFYVLDSSYIQYTGLPPTLTLVDRTTIVLADTMAGATVSGQIRSYADGLDDGVNPAHLLYQLLFRSWPHGYALSTDAFDLESLNECGVTFAAERLSSHLYLQDGQDFLGAVSAVMQDAGIMVSLVDGKWKFRALRAETSIVVVPDDVLSGPPPERRTNHGDRPSTTSSFRFRDRARGYRTSTVSVSDNGVAEYVARTTSRPVELELARDFDTASRIAERRGMEDQGTPATFDVTAGRECREITPGRAIQVAGIPGTLRVVSRKIDALSSKVVLHCALDYQGSSTSSFITSEGGGINVDAGAIYPDPVARIVEIPAHLLASQSQQLIVVPRLRATDSVLGADIHLSGDNVSYFQVQQDIGVTAGGLLLAPMLATDPVLQENGPVFTTVGPDIGAVPDLTTDILNWRRGRLLCVIGGEICFIRSITALGGAQYQLNGLIRARYDTPRVAHAAGESVLIFEYDALPTITDPLLVPNAPIWVKTQPFASSSIDLSSITAITATLRGKGPVPMQPPTLRTSNNSNSFRAGEQIDLRWTYRSPRSPRTGAGMQGAGEPVGISAPMGQFTLRFKNSTGTITRREVTGLTTPSYSYSNAQMVQDFTGEPTSLRVSVEEVLGGYVSGETEIVITKV